MIYIDILKYNSTSSHYYETVDSFSNKHNGAIIKRHQQLTDNTWTYSLMLLRIAPGGAKYILEKEL